MGQLRRGRIQNFAKRGVDPRGTLWARAPTSNNNKSFNRVPRGIRSLINTAYHADADKEKENGKGVYRPECAQPQPGPLSSSNWGGLRFTAPALAEPLRPGPLPCECGYGKMKLWENEARATRNPIGMALPFCNTVLF